MRRSVTTFDGREVHLIGMAATGVAAARVLRRRGARVVAHDQKPAERLGETPAQLAALGVECRVGDEAYQGLERADLIVPSPGVPAHAEVLQAAMARGTPVRSEIELAWEIARAPILAVTGTNGKTTTVLMLGEILQADGREVTVAGNLLAGGRQLPLIAAADEAGPEAWIVAEVSSFQLEWVCGFRPRVAVITNITADHLDRHGTVEAYVAAKARLLDAQTPEDTAVLNGDNPAARGLAGRGRGRRLWFSRREPGTHPSAAREGCEHGAWLARGRDGTDRIVARVDGPEVEIGPASMLSVPGEHMVENALAAAAAALAVDARPAAVAGALAAFRGTPDRLEHVATVGGREFVNNTMCTNVDAAVRSIEAYDRPVVLIAGGKDKGSDFAPLGRTIARRVKQLVAIGADGPRIADSARQAGFDPDRIHRATSMEEAVAQASAVAEPGDVVLLAPACASFDWYNGFEERGRAFKEAIAKLVL
jgi:UDP-N-acetylmuramoylalanine--D-glutamate ligase